MSSTAKERFNQVQDTIEKTAATVHAADREDFLKELRNGITRQLAALKRGDFDRHTSAAIDGRL